MTQLLRRSVVLFAALAVPAAAQPSPEALSLSAAGRFSAATGLNAAVFRPTTSAGAPALTGAEADEFVRALTDSASAPRAAEVRASAATQAAELELAPLLNRHLKTRLRFTLSGRTVWFSGAFDRAQKPYVSVLVDGSPALYYDVKALLDQDQRLSVGGRPYTLSLSANIFHKMKSTINLKNDANSREVARFSVQDMLDAVSAAGEPLRLSDQSYKFYYADSLDGSRVDPNAHTFVFIYGDVKDFHVYLIPEALVPTGKMGVFKLFNDKRVGLARVNGRLQVFENP